MNNEQNKISLDLEYLRSIRPHFEILCYGSQLYTNFFQSMLDWTATAGKYGIKWSYNILSNESLITRARNLAAANFLTTEATHLVFIDVDQGFRAEELLVLLNHKKDIIVAPVPLKTFPLTYNINPIPGELPVDGLVRLARAGTGCMIISRQVLEKLKSHPNVYKFENDIKFENGHTIDGQHLYTYFDTCVRQDHTGTARFMSEDYDFCEKIVDQGGEIWCDTRLVLSHMGKYDYNAANINNTEKILIERRKQIEKINNNVEKGELQNGNK